MCLKSICTTYPRYIHRILLNVDMSQGEAIEFMKLEPFVKKVMAVPDDKLDPGLIAKYVKCKVNYDEVISFRHVHIVLV